MLLGALAAHRAWHTNLAIIRQAPASRHFVLSAIRIILCELAEARSEMSGPYDFLDPVGCSSVRLGSCLFLTKTEYDREIFSWVPRGRPIGQGATALIKLMPDRIVLKIPAGDIGWHEINRRDLWKEAGIYARLGRHPCLPTVYSFDPDSCELGLEYMSNSNLHDYLIAHDTEINPKQRLQWVIDMLEGLCHIHRFGILHADLTPRNLLLDDKLLLKICDFAGSSVDGSLPTGIPGRRYIMIHSSSTRDFSIQDELFTLGCTIYHIVTGHAPYHDRNEHEVSEMYERGEFPDISSLLLGEIICKYWTGDLKTAEEGFRAALAHFFSEYFAPKNNAP